MWLSASVIENTLIVLDLAKVQDVYKHAALCSETLETCEKSLEELVWRCVSLLREARFQRKHCFSFGKNSFSIVQGQQLHWRRLSLQFYNTFRKTF